MLSHHLEAMAHEIEQAARQRSAETRWRDPERGWLRSKVVSSGSPAAGNQWWQGVWRCWQRGRGGQRSRANAGRPLGLHDLAQV